ncbi:hypothetical protein MKX01_024938 [Papaver californicum]|nr:hypothetical protein MKX01_024938 [Papaver californicum]
MDKENEKIKNHQEKGTDNPTNHLSGSDNSMEVSSDSSGSKVDEGSDSSKVVVCQTLIKIPHEVQICISQWKSMIETDSYLIDLQYQFYGRDKKPLLFISSAPSPPKERAEGTIDFTSVGPTEVQKLELHRSKFGIPKQTVAGLVCITSRREAFLIYNPSTGERTPWIEPTIVNENIGEERRREVNCIAFRYSPRTKEYKVLCRNRKRPISLLPSRPGFTEEDRVFCFQKLEEDAKESSLFNHADDFEEVGADEEQVCEVFTVGENTWRRIDAVPPYSLVNKVCYVGELGQYNEDSKSVYVRGKIHWRFRYTRAGEVLMVFDVTAEKFLVIPIPGYVTETPWRYPQTVELLEVDGHIAVLNFTPGCPISLWILDQDDGSNKWSYEKVRTPCNWNGNLDLSIEAISVNEIYELNYQPGELREILTLVDSLAPVCTKYCNMF